MEVAATAAVLSEVRERVLGYQFCEHDIQRIVYWSWCTIEHYESVLRTEYNFTDSDVEEEREDYGDANYVLTAIDEATVGRDEGESYDYIDLVDGDHWFIRVEPDDSFEITAFNEGSQPAYYGGPRDEAREWVAKFGEVHDCVYESDSKWQ